jgi:diguanylate cyclase (GGDEF)-like protein
VIRSAMATRQWIQAVVGTALLLAVSGCAGYINDSLGHLVGDQVLIGVASRLQRSVRPDDTVSRISGDEFAVLLNEVASDQEARAVAERALDGVREPFIFGSRNLVVSASIGVRVVRADDRDAQDVMRGADLAMYEAKASGRGRVGAHPLEPDQIEERLRREEAGVVALGA